MSEPKPWHRVTVTAQYDEEGNELTPEVKFECSALYGACHFYPHCDCEWIEENHFAEWGVGHEKVHHDECWMRGWFENGGADYAGEDADEMGDYGIPAGMNRSGVIKASCQGDYIEWEFATQGGQP